MLSQFPTHNSSRLWRKDSEEAARKLRESYQNAAKIMQKGVAELS